MLDMLLRGGRIVDPETLSIFCADVGIQNGKIAGLFAPDAPVQAREIVDISGLAVSPGFIDIHAHLDGHWESGRRALRQGITTSFGGNCGSSPRDMAAFLRAQESGFCVNQGEFCGQSFTLRTQVGLDDINAPATLNQISAMEKLAERDLQAGAWGVSFGLDYAPGCSYAEIEALGRVTAAHGGICPIHTRLFSMFDMYSIAEAARLALDTGVQVQISHMVYQYPLDDLIDEAFEVIDYARSKGAKILCDSGMYTDFAAPLGTATFDQATLDLCCWEYDHLLVSTGPYKGERLNAALYKKLRAEAPGTEIICFSGEDSAILHAFDRDYVMISTDAGNYQPGQGHPQAAASFPLFFKRLVREEKRLSLPEAVRRATLLPAETMGLTQKGRIRAGMDADLVVFDPDTIDCRADFAGVGVPDCPPEGIHLVILNGETAVKDNVILNDCLGKVLKKNP